MIDVNDGLGGEGPYSAQRCGGLPTNAALRLIDKVGIDQVVAELRAKGEL